MKSQIIKWAAIGFPVGICIGLLITIAISYMVGDGIYYPVTPQFEALFDSQLNALTFQTALCGLLGAICAAGSLIWETDNWSLVRQTATHFALLSLTMLPIAYICHWMAHTAAGIISYFAIFIIIYIFIWAVNVVIWKLKINQINKKIE
ncbi:MAG: DUF3021 domain-containing protein [Oscillospiraceae bacterium]